MIITDPMELVSVVVFREKAEDISSYLLHAGAFHPVDIRSIEEELKGLSLVEIGSDYDAFDRLQAKAMELCSRLGITPEPRKNLSGLTSGGAVSALETIDAQIGALLAEKRESQDAIKASEAILSQVKDVLPFPIQQDHGFSLLYVSLGTIEEKNLPMLERSLGELAHLLYPLSQRRTKAHALFLCLRRDRQLAQKVLTDVGWQEEEMPQGRQFVTDEVQERMHKEIAERRARVVAIDAEAGSLRVSSREECSRIYSFAALNKSLLDAKRYAVNTDKTVIFSGWVPADEKVRLLAGVRQITGEAYAEAVRPEETGVAKEDVPVRFAQNPFLKPFGMLVESYGVPRYGSLDPTIFVALSFVFMFGLMFGDLGQGLVLALAGVGLLLKGRGSVILRQFGALLLYCGSSAAVFGLMEGSVFGYEFHSLFEEPLKNVGGMLSFSVYAGIVIISAGILINIVNALRNREYSRFFFDKAGLIGALVYWSAVAAIIKAMFEHSVVPGWLYLVIGGGVAALFVFPLVEFFVRRGHAHGSFLESFMESLLGLLEFAMGYLANTVSFVRMGAFALAHAALLLSVFQIAGMFRIPGMPIGVVVMGNIGVMVLEGLVVGIQSLRLNYYEFFSKFFIAGKSLFKPLSVST